MSSLLSVESLSVRYGRVHAVRGASLSIDEGEVVAVLGANGAGKSSLLKGILGLVPADEGVVRFGGRDLTSASPAQRIVAGMALVPEGRRLLMSLTVEENLLMGAYLRRDGAAVRKEIDALYARFPNLAARRALPASVLSGGEQQMLAIGRGILARPKLMLLDEPSLGLSPLLVQALFRLLAELNRAGLALLLVARNPVDEINAAGGVNGRKLRYITFDTAGNPGQTVVGLRKLAEDDKVLAIIGPFSSGQVQVAAPAADRTGVVIMAMASSAPKLVANFKYAFRNTSDEGYMFDRVMRTLKAKGYPIATGAVAYANDDTISRVMGEKVLPGLMQTNGVQLKGAVEFTLGAFDFSAQVAQLKANPTDLVGVGAPPEAAIKLAQELRRQGHNGRLVAGPTLNDPDLPDRMGSAGHGTV